MNHQYIRLFREIDLKGIQGMGKPTGKLLTDVLVEEKLNEAYDRGIEHAIAIVKYRAAGPFPNMCADIISSLEKLKSK
jgi:hypothetical protein